jgi:hypothetical protein
MALKRHDSMGRLAATLLCPLLPCDCGDQYGVTGMEHVDVPKKRAIAGHGSYVREGEVETCAEEV